MSIHNQKPGGPQNHTVYILACEHSGDLHGEKIILALKQLDPSLKIIGVGGPRMRSAGLKCLLPMEEFQVMGFVDVFLALPKLARHFYHLAKQILTLNPKAVLFIDYPGFNLRLAKRLRKKGFRHILCHYICPSVWAWRPGRIQTMSDHLNLLLTILPFEEKHFSHTPLNVQYVGHPLVQRIKEHVPSSLLFPPNKKVIALFPGSRKKEIERNLPLQLQACQQLEAHCKHLHFALSIADKSFLPLIQEKVALHAPTLSIQHVPAQLTYELMSGTYLAIAKSGTVTLELALHQVPTVVTYAISTCDLWIAKYFFRINLPYYCLVNIMANKEIFPELFGPHFTANSLYKKAKQLIHHQPSYKKCTSACAELITLLGDQDASQAAAAALYAAICS